MNDNHDAEYEVHANTWRDFTRLMTAGVIFCIVVLIGMAVTLV